MQWIHNLFWSVISRTFLSTGKKEIEEFMRSNPSVQYPWTVIKTKIINTRRQRQDRLKKTELFNWIGGDMHFINVWHFSLKSIFFRLHYLYLFTKSTCNMRKCTDWSIVLGVIWVSHCELFINVRLCWQSACSRHISWSCRLQARRSRSLG